MFQFNSINNHIKKFLFIKKELIYGAHLTSLSATCIIFSVIIILNLPIDFFALLAAYLMTYIVYSYNYQNEIDDDVNTNPEKFLYLKERKSIYPYLLGFSLIALFLLLVYISNIKFIIFMLILLCGGILYTTIFKVLTEYIAGFKSIYVTTMLTYFVVFYAIFLYSLNIDYNILLITLIILIKLLINIVFFDIKDIESDSNKNLKTFPILLGKKNTIYLLHILNIIVLCVLIYGIYINTLPLFTAVLIVFFFYTFFYLHKGLTATKNELLYYTYIMADAEFIFWPIVLLIANAIIL